METVKGSVFTRCRKYEEMNRQRAEDFQGSGTVVYDNTMVDTCHYTFVKTIEYTIPRVNTSVNYGLWMIMMWQRSFISYNKGTTQLQGVDSGEGCTYARAGDMSEISVPFIQFCCEPKAALKKQSVNHKSLYSENIN